MPRAPRGRGFTLIELMVVVAIIGLLAAIAIPSFIRNARKAKSSEAAVHLRRMYVSSRSYILEQFATRTGVLLPAQFPDSQALTPAASCCTFPGSKCPPNPVDWNTPTWMALQFSVDDPHYYRYQYESTGSTAPGPGSRFTARALGDLTCDGVFSTFEMVGEWSSSDHDVHGSAAIHGENVTE